MDQRWHEPGTMPDVERTTSDIAAGIIRRRMREFDAARWEPALREKTPVKVNGVNPVERGLCRAGKGARLS